MNAITDHDRALLHALVCSQQGVEISDACARTISYLFAPPVPKPSVAAFQTTGMIVSSDRIWQALFSDDDSRWQYGHLSADDQAMADALGTYLIRSCDASGTRMPVPGWSDLGAGAIYLTAEH